MYFENGVGWIKEKKWRESKLGLITLVMGPKWRNLGWNMLIGGWKNNETKLGRVGWAFEYGCIFFLLVSLFASNNKATLDHIATSYSASPRTAHRVLGAIVPSCFLLAIFLIHRLCNFEFEFDFSFSPPTMSFTHESWISTCLLITPS